MRVRCRWALCPETALDGSKYCHDHAGNAQAKYAAYTSLYERGRRKYDGQFRSFYQSKEWQEVRAEVLAKQPVCAWCKRAFATAVHHNVPLKEDWSKRLDKANLVPLCATCHSKHELHERSSQRSIKVYGV